MRGRLVFWVEESASQGVSRKPNIIAMKKRDILVVIILLLAVSFVPYNLTIASKREFTILASGNEPIENALAKQVWDQYGLHYTDEEELRSDIDEKLVSRGE